MTEWYKTGDYPEKSWSISKMKVLQNCLREYYYTYYGSHKGWLFESSDEQKISWRLKKLTNIWLMFGDKLHEMAKYKISDNGNQISVEQMKEYMRNNLNLGVKSSIGKARSGEWDEYPKGEMLQEYYYGEGLKEESISDIKERIEICTSGLILSKSYREVKNEAKEILEADDGKFDSILVLGVKVYALIDLLYVDESGNYIIVDWKTGKPGEQDKEQLMVYALYVMEKYGVTLDKIIGRIEYLLLGENVEYRFNEVDVENIKHRIEMDLNVIDAFLEDKIQNKPIAKDNFLMSDNVNKCRKCKFRRLCLY